MAQAGIRTKGFTLIELMVTLAVIVVLLLVAVPSFESFRQRAALRAAGDQVLSIWSTARMEAAKRNLPVDVAVTSSGANFCLGTTTIESGNTTPCDCFESDDTQADFCDISRYPGEQSQWRGVTLVGTPTLGSNTGHAAIEPKRTDLTVAADAGTVELAGPAGRNAYRMRVSIDRFGRAVQCEPTSATSKMSDFSKRRCDP